MKAVLEFDLDESDDIEKFEMHNQAMGMWHTLWELDQELRNTVKYQQEVLHPKEIDIHDKIREKLHELMAENSVNLDVLS